MWSSSTFHLCLPGEHPGAGALPARGRELAERSCCSRVLVEHQPLHGLEPGFTHGIKSNDRARPLNHTQPGWRGKQQKVRIRESTHSSRRRRAAFFPCWNHEGIMRGAVPSATAPGHGQKPQPFLRHPSVHALPAPSRAAVFPRAAGKGERGRCPACTSLPANGNSGSGPRLSFPRLVQPSVKLAMVLLPFARGLEQGWEPSEGEVQGLEQGWEPRKGEVQRDGSPGKGRCGYPAAPAAAPPAAPSRSASRQGSAGSRPAPGCLLLLGDAGGTVPITFPSRSRFMSLPKALLQPSRKAGAGGWRGGGSLRGIVNLLSYTAAYHCATVIP